MKVVQVPSTQYQLIPANAWEQQAIELLMAQQPERVVTMHPVALEFEVERLAKELKKAHKHVAKQREKTRKAERAFKRAIAEAVINIADIVDEDDD